MLHERPGGPDLPPSGRKPRHRGYQMHLDIMDYVRGTTTLHFIFCIDMEKSWFRISIRTLEYPLEESWWIRDSFSYYTNPIGNHPINLIISSLYLHISILFLHSLRPAFCGTLGGALRSTELRSTAQVHLQWDYSNALCTSQWDFIHKLDNDKILVLGLISTELDHRRVAGKDTCCRSTADNSFTCTE